MAILPEVPVAHCYPLTSPMVPLTYWSIALAISARFTPLRNFMFRTRGLCLSHQLSALSPASRVQWIRDCWPAPIPITCRTQTRESIREKRMAHPDPFVFLLLGVGEEKTKILKIQQRFTNRNRVSLVNTEMLTEWKSTQSTAHTRYSYLVVHLHSI